MAIAKAKNIYILSQAGFLLYLKFVEGEESVKIYKQFIEDYFKTKAENKEMKSVLQDELEELENQRAAVYGKLIVQKEENIRFELSQELENISQRTIKVHSAIDNRAIREALEKQARLSKDKENYILLSDFGDRFNCKIGAKMIGKLLRIIQIAKRSRIGTTVPYKIDVPKYAYNNLGSSVNYVWNYNECIKVLDNWLKSHDEFEHFYSITDSAVMEMYVNSLFVKYCFQGNEEE